MGKLIARQSALSTNTVTYFLTNLLIAQLLTLVGTMIHVHVHCIGAARYCSHMSKGSNKTSNKGQTNE